MYCFLKTFKFLLKSQYKLGKILHKWLRSLLSWEIQQKEALRVWRKDNEVMFSH